MKTDQLRTLQTLRVLREQRAANQLAAQQQRCAQTHDVLTDAKEQLRLHREAIAEEARQVYAALTEGLSVASWQAAQERLRGLSDDQQLLENYAAVIDELMRAKPSAAKGKYIKSITLSSTMGPGVRLDNAVADAAGKH